MSMIRVAEPMMAARTISKDLESKLARCYLTLRVIPHTYEAMPTLHS